MMIDSEETLRARLLWVDGKLLYRHGVSVLRQSRTPKKPKSYNRYNRPVPGDRVQLDTCTIGKKLTTQMWKRSRANGNVSPIMFLQ